MRRDGASPLRLIGRGTRVIASVAAAATLATAVLQITGADSTLVFAVSAVALSALAFLVGAATDHLGPRLGHATTGVVQSALGNLPELFIGFFALREGLVVVVQTALIGSILANTLLVLGLAFVVGGLRHGRQRFNAEPMRNTAILLVLSVASLAIPTLATARGAPDFGHAGELSIVVSIVLLIVFVASLPASLGRDAEGGAAAEDSAEPVAEAWPLWMSLGLLGMAALAAAFVSEWFVSALRPAMAQLGWSEAFVGLVVVAIAGNAVENVAGIQAAARNKSALAVSLILNSSLQIALVLIPALVLLSAILGGATLTLAAPVLLVGALGLTTLLAALITIDGESTWLEGLALVGLYVIIAASVWFGPPIHL
jgi:Ca2+:H+ antiporter